jgi:hypothetical protein
MIPFAAPKLRSQIMIAMPPMTIPATIMILNRAIANVIGAEFFGFARRTRVAALVLRESIRSTASSVSAFGCE